MNLCECNMYLCLKCTVIFNRNICVIMTYLSKEGIQILHTRKYELCGIKYSQKEFIQFKKLSHIYLLWNMTRLQQGAFIEQ